MTNSTDNGNPPHSLSASAMVDLRDRWPALVSDDRVQEFSSLTLAEAKDLFLSLKAAEQADLVQELPEKERMLWVRLLAPDDLADFVQAVPEDSRPGILAQLGPMAREEVNALLAYDEDEAGGLMNPRFARVRPEMTVDAALRYLRRQAHGVETTHYVYVLDSGQRLLGVVSLRRLFISDGNTVVQDIMRNNVVTATDTLSQEEIASLVSRSGLGAVPVVDENSRMVGIITVDDIVDVVEEEATEDIQRLGGSEVLDAPYLQIGLLSMIRKRAGWLVLLFVGEMLTATAMAFFEKEIERAIVLALFIPLIISSGGNAGSQASTLVVRAIALREIRLRDWWRVFVREVIAGMTLGVILGSIGLLRILLWPTRNELYGEHFALIGMVVAISVMGVVLWGSLAGSMLPFILRRLKLDPATSSAPLVATLVDVSGLVIYFTVASFLLAGTLL